MLSNIIYKEASKVVMEAVTYPKYEGEQNVGYNRIIEEYLYDKIFANVIKKDFEPMVKEAIVEKGLLISRPLITFGLNLRDPLEIILYEKIMSIVR
jgi:hypothetical protein